jgi:hypothetical protein
MIMGGNREQLQAEDMGQTDQRSVDILTVEGLLFAL